MKEKIQNLTLKPGEKITEEMLEELSDGKGEDE
jgi:DNA-binding GntR family transcriptional regulator